VVNEAHTLGKSVVVSIGGAYPASLGTNFGTIAASATLRDSFANNIVAFLQANQLDGLDIDYEFPADATARANFTLLMQTIYAKVKLADSRYIVMFGSGPGWYLGSFDFAALQNHCDFFFYFGYDWKNPANGPMRKPGSTQWTSANDQLGEASVKGGVDYVIGKTFPASKIIVASRSTARTTPRGPPCATLGPRTRVSISRPLMRTRWKSKSAANGSPHPTR